MPKKPKTQEIARAFLASAIMYDGHLLDAQSDILFHADEQAFYHYSPASGAWVIIPVGDRDTGPLARMLSAFLETNFPDVDANSAAIKELRSAIVRIMGNVVGEDTHELARYTAFRDGLFDWTAFELVPHDKAKIAFHSFPFDCPHGAQVIHTPVFDAYLARAFKDDQAMQAFVPEMIGYYMLPRTKEPAAFYLYGQARSGKSVMLDLIRELIGDRFTCSFSLQSLTGDKFTVAELAGKRVNIQDEDESEFILSDKFKALISQAKVQAERKYGTPFTFRPRCKLLFGSNQLPMFKNVDEGLMRRLRFIEYKHPLRPEEQDKEILEKLVGELPGIVQRAMRAAEAFMSRGQEFVLSESSLRTAEQFAIESEPALSFMDECYQVFPDAADDAVPSEGWTAFADIYKHYREWCKENGKYPKSSQKLVKILDRVPGLKAARNADARFRSCARRGVPTYPKPLF